MKLRLGGRREVVPPRPETPAASGDDFGAAGPAGGSVSTHVPMGTTDGRGKRQVDFADSAHYFRTAPLLRSGEFALYDDGTKLCLKVQAAGREKSYVVSTATGAHDRVAVLQAKMGGECRFVSAKEALVETPRYLSPESLARRAGLYGHEVFSARPEGQLAANEIAFVQPPGKKLEIHRGTADGTGLVTQVRHRSPLDLARSGICGVRLPEGPEQCRFQKRGLVVGTLAPDVSLDAFVFGHAPQLAAHEVAIHRRDDLSGVFICSHRRGVVADVEFRPEVEPLHLRTGLELFLIPDGALVG